jgi:hypothetical protein
VGRKNLRLLLHATIRNCASSSCLACSWDGGARKLLCGERTPPATTTMLEEGPLMAMVAEIGRMTT